MDENGGMGEGVEGEGEGREKGRGSVIGMKGSVWFYGRSWCYILAHIYIYTVYVSKSSVDETRVR